MKPAISILCQEGGLPAALDYASLISREKIPLVVNFPNAEGYPRTAETSRLVNPRLGAVLLILSSDMFTPFSRSSKWRVDNALLQELTTFAKQPSRVRLFLIVTDATAEEKIKDTWMGELQWVRDNAINRETIFSHVKKLSNAPQAHDEITSFKNVKSIISDIEPGCTIETVASERATSERVSYEIFKCRHKIKKQGTYYIHLHKGITISHAARHLWENHPEIYNDSDRFIVLGIERGQTRLSDRIENVKTAFETDNVEYLENIVSQLVAERVDATGVKNVEVARRSFIEPEVREGLGSAQVASSYAKVLARVGGARAGVLVLVGQGGIGKTWAMMNLRDTITTRAMSFDKPVQPSVVFIPALDIVRGFARSNFQPHEITLYDLYTVSRGGSEEDHAEYRLNKETFYNALELGTLVVFVDGLDEVVARYRGRFNVSHFFDDLKDRMSAESDGKVIVSCRNIFFDQDEYRFSHPFIETYELLAFDAARRTAFFQEGLSEMPRKLERAIGLSDRLAKLPEGLFLPFVLDLIKDMMFEQADELRADDLDRFQSGVLTLSDPYDRIVGQFCHREMVKTSDPIRELSVDEQVAIFCSIARKIEGSREAIRDPAIELIMSTLLNKKEVSGYVESFRSHPFISQEVYKQTGIYDFRFDFMPEYFLMLDTFIGFSTDRAMGIGDVRVINKFCSMNSLFARGICHRLQVDASDFRLKVIEVLESGRGIIEEEFAPEDAEILRPDSAIARFSFAILSLLAAFETRNGTPLGESFTEAVREVFGTGSTLYRLAILDGFFKEDERIKLDFRGYAADSCLFHSFDFWDCKFDDGSVFSRCRFVDCGGAARSNASALQARFKPDCILDTSFAKVYASIIERGANTDAQNNDAIREFVSEFYKGGGFMRVKKAVLESKYGNTNNYVSFKTMYKLMRNLNIIEEVSSKAFLDVQITRSASSWCEKLLTQGVIGGPLKDAAIELRRDA